VTAIALPFNATARDKVAQFDCDKGVCGFNVTAAEMRIAPCRGASVLVAYSQNSGATLIQCSMPGNISGSLSYLFDWHSTDGAEFELKHTRFIKPSFLAEATESGIPDRFGPVPLCMPTASTTSATGELLLVVKTPHPGADESYCYRLLRIRDDAGGLVINSADGPAPAPSTTARAKWRSLLAVLRPYIQSAAHH
jgi:hypothetical protein